LIILCLSPVGGLGAQQGQYTVLIDPSHGGDDPGVVSDQLREKDLTLNLALLIRQEAKKTPGLQIQLTRLDDRTVTTADRIKTALSLKPDCLISLHVNAGFGKKATGYEVYFPGFRQAGSGTVNPAPILKDMEQNRHLNDSVRLAQRIQGSLESVFPRKGRGLREAPVPLLEGLNLPGLVVEVGFATYPEDRKKLSGAEAQRAVARALLKGLQDYFQKGP
jgi:N-acetylmuramoyl-L-alanine amidase